MILLAPASTAEFGPEDEHGWPINIHGETVKPPVELKQTDFLDSLNPYDPLNKIGPVTLYPYYPILTAEVIRLADEYPHLVKLTSAGKSHAQLDLWMLEIADFTNPDKIPLEEREVVYLDGGIHSNEYSAVYFLTEIAQFLIEEYDTNETARWIVENRHTWLIPMVNPDGSNVFGRMNANWVNLNRNFPGTWGEVDENIAVNNPGPHPGSEPETQIIMRVLDELKPDYVNSVHCCGNLWLHPWGAQHLAEEMNFEQEDAEMYRRTCDEAFMDVRQYCGEIWSTIYPASGTTADEGYHRIGASSWTYEMSGRGAISLWGQPAIIEDVRVQEIESWEGTLHAFLNVHKYGAHPEIVHVEGTHDRLEVTIENIGYGNFTQGTLTVGDQVLEIPFMRHSPRDEAEPRSLTTLSVEGDFEEGALEMELDWTKRVRHAPQGWKPVTILLEEQDGRLVGVSTGHIVDDGHAGPQETPAFPWVGLVLLGALGLGVLRRRSE
jgi:LPXTG-motif cell wall-anchored protein